MTAPLYMDPPARRSLEPAGNLGLWYTRFFDRYDRQAWSLENDDKRLWIGTATRDRSHGALRKLLETYADRRFDLIESWGGAMREYQTVWHFATGLGLPHPVENGLAWHPTLGMPYLPGSSVKGLLAAWLFTVEHDADQTELIRAEARRRRDLWCGKAEEPGGDEDPGHAGSLIFFDALPTKPPTLGTDVMTPHMGQWYAEGDSISNVDLQPEKVPADWHSPVPVPFLVVTNACLVFSIAPRPGAPWEGRQPKAEANAALDELEKALKILGAGAKTAVGYGRFRQGSGYLAAKIRQREEDIEAEMELARLRAKLEPFEGFDPPIVEVLGHNKLEGLTTIVLKAMESGTWPKTECIRLAHPLKEWMVGRDEWVAGARDLPEKKKKKDKKVLKTLKVMEWLEKGN